MISLINLCKEYPIRGGVRAILKNINLSIEPHEKLGILGCNGAGKSTLVKMISGAELPTSGRIERKMSVSWPIALGEAFHNSCTGLDNIRLICRFYNIDWRKRLDFIEEFSELGIYLREPIISYSSGMRARLAFAISMVIEFDCYLIDEIFAVGDSRFHARCERELFQRREDRSKVIVSHDANFIRQHCQKVAVLLDGLIYHFVKVEQGLEFYENTMALISSQNQDQAKTDSRISFSLGQRETCP